MGRLVRVVDLALIVHASAQVVCFLRFSKLSCQLTNAFKIGVRHSRIWARHMTLNPLELSEVVLQVIVWSAIV